MREGQDLQSRVFYDLCSLLFSILCHPPPPSPISSTSSSSSRRVEISPLGFAALMLGISLSLVLCGSITLLLGLVLMPWVLGFVAAFYLIGFVSNLSVLWWALLLGNPIDSRKQNAW